MLSVNRPEKRKLTNEEISHLVSFIKPFKINPKLPADEAAIAIADAQRYGFVRQLQNVLVYPQILKPLRDALEMGYKRALIDAGKSVGALASTSIGERNTQQSLSCVDWNERVLIIHKGKCIEDYIGSIVDNIITSSRVKFRDPYIEQDPNISNPIKDGFIESRAVQDMWIPAVDENGYIQWRKIEAVMRHPLYNRLLQVKLRSGRTVMATSAKSFLTRKNNKIVATAGSELKIGDRLPINVRLPFFKENTHFNLREILSPTKYIFGSEMWKCRRIREDCHSRGIRPLWKENNGVNFTVPYTRFITAMSELEGIKKEKIGHETIKENCVYKTHRRTANIPEHLPLTKEFGFFIGLYLARGRIINYYISIMYDPGSLDTILKFVNAYDIGYKCIDSKLEESKEEKLEVNILCSLLTDIIENTCGRHDKNVPYFAYNAPKEFIASLLSGYFSCNGSFSENGDIIISESTSLHLLQGISWLLTYFNIYSHIEVSHFFKLKIDHKSVSKFHNHIQLTNKGSQQRLNKSVQIKHSYTYSPHDEINGINFPSVPAKIHRDNLATYGDKFQSLIDCDVMFDEIISIEDVAPSHGYVYDFTVEGTRTFSLLSGVEIFDSFHTSGQQKANLLVGVPRMEELVNVTRDIKTPSMEIWLNYSEEKLRDLSFVRRKAFDVLQLREVIDFIIDYNICHNRKITEDENKWYHIHNIFIGSHHENCEWSIRFIFDPKLLYQNRMALSTIVKIIHENYGDAHCVMSPDNVGIIDVYVDTDELGNIEEVIQLLKNNRRKSKKKKDEDDVELYLFITDENKEFYFLRDLVLPSILHLQVGKILGIKQCFFQELHGLWYIITDGSNLKAVVASPIVDGYKTTTNHLWDTFELLGIEAARQLLRREFEKVIGVGQRHIELLIDSMTCSGRPQPASSRGINIKDVGLLAKISFEHAWEHFFKGAMVAETDKIRGAASSIVAGNVPPLGSGYMGLVDEKNELLIDEDAELYNHFVVMSKKLEVQKQVTIPTIHRSPSVQIPNNIERKRTVRPSVLSKLVPVAPFTPSLSDIKPRIKSHSGGILDVPLAPSSLDDTGKEELRRMESVKPNLFGNNGKVVETEDTQEIY